MWADYDIVDLVDNYRYLYTMLLHFILKSTLLVFLRSFC